MTTITVTIWHNVAVDGQGHHTGMLDGYQPGDPMVRVFTYQADPAGRLPEDIAEETFAICNGHPRDTRGADLAEQCYQRRPRSLSVGDVVAVGEVALAVGRPAGWDPVRGSRLLPRHPARTSGRAGTGRYKAPPPPGTSSFRAGWA